MERLVAAAADEAEDRRTARSRCGRSPSRAGVAPATAYTYFSGKDHLLAEVLWRGMQSSLHLVDVNQPVQERVAETVRTMGFDTMATPAVAVCTTALLADGPDVMRVRSRIGAEISRRLASALGPGFDPAVRNVLTVTYTGALLSAGMGHLSFDAVPAVMVEAVGLMTARPTETDTDTDTDTDAGPTS